MIRSVAVGVGWRYAFSRRSSISFISAVAVLGLALSVAVLVVVISVINGFERELKTRVLGLLPHVTLYARDPFPQSEEDLEKLRQMAGIAGAVAFIQGAGLAAAGNRQSGVLIAGIEPEQYQSVSGLAAFTTTDGLAPLVAGEFGVWLGAGVASSLRVNVGDSVTLVLPSALVTPAGLFPRQKRFRLLGIIQTRSELDSRAAYVHQQDAQRLFRLGDRVHGYQIRLEDLFSASGVADQAVAAIGGERVFARTWMRSHGTLYHAIGVQKTTMFVLLSFLVAVAAFNLISTLVMVVDQRGGDIAILRTLGSDTGTVVWAFVLLGGCLGIAGIAIGLIVGVGFSAALPGVYAAITDTFALDLMNQYFVSYLPVEIRLQDLSGITLTALVLCIGSTLYPAWRAASLRPSEVLAHE